MGRAAALTAGAIAEAVEGRLVSGEAGQAIDGFAIDSRTLAPGDLFFAIVAARDGHEFVADALDRGACGAVVEAGRGAAVIDRSTAAASADRAGGSSTGTSPVVIEVGDTTRALQELGRDVRRRSGATVVAITGSAGKTTTKEAIAEFLSAKYVVVKNRGNLNNHLGLPLSLLELRRGADVAVMELGMNHAGEIRTLVGIAEPEVRVWINVGDAHLGHFASRDEIADAKGEILEGASADAVLVCNADDPQIMSRARRFAGRVVSFGLSEPADVRAERVEELGLDGMTADIRTPAASGELRIPLLGRGNLANVLAATAVATELGVPFDRILERARELQPAPHRGAVIRLASGITVVDDSYNSSPTALQRALEVIAHDRQASRKAAVLGEMLELGEHATELHQRSGRAAAEARLDRLVAVGGEAARVLANAAISSGMPASTVTWVATSAEAAALITAWLRAGDLVLVKGSRGIRTDAVVDRIRAERG